MPGDRAVRTVACDAIAPCEERRPDDIPPARADDGPEEIELKGGSAVPARSIRSEENPDQDQDERGDVKENREVPGGDGIPDPVVVFAAFLEDVSDTLERQGDHDEIEAREDEGEA